MRCEKKDGLRSVNISLFSWFNQVCCSLRRFFFQMMRYFDYCRLSLGCEMSDGSFLFCYVNESSFLLFQYICLLTSFLELL